MLPCSPFPFSILGLVLLFVFLDLLSVFIPHRAASSPVAGARRTVSYLLHKLLLPLPRSRLPCSFLVP